MRAERRVWGYVGVWDKRGRGRETILSLRRAFCFWLKTVKGLMLSSYIALYLEELGIESILASTSTCKSSQVSAHTHTDAYTRHGSM